MLFAARQCVYRQAGRLRRHRRGYPADRQLLSGPHSAALTRADELARSIGLDPAEPREGSPPLGIASSAERSFTEHCGGPPDSDESGSVEVAPAASARPAVIDAVCDALGG